MGEVAFYHLTDTPLERALPPLLQRALGQGWRVEVRGPDRARMDWLDQILWLGPEEGFLPHGLAGGPHDALQPVLLTHDTAAPDCPCLMSVLGAEVTGEEAAQRIRSFILFDGHDPGAVEHARGQWRSLTATGLPAKYWAQEGGAWVLKQDRRS